MDRIRDVLPSLTIREYSPEELANEAEWDVAMVHAPVFADGRARYNITVHLRRTGVSAGELYGVGKLVVEAAQHCSELLRNDDVIPR
jgi:uncharacterized protein (DUF934 family)